MKYLSVVLLMVSSSAFGHSQYPSRIVKEPFYESQAVSIAINNLNNYVQSYELAVDGKVLGVVKNLGPGIERKLTVTLKDIKAGTKKAICTTSILKKDQTVRSRVCTKVEFKWQ